MIKGESDVFRFFYLILLLLLGGGGGVWGYHVTQIAARTRDSNIKRP